jgi:hypothetical protein
MIEVFLRLHWRHKTIMVCLALAAAIALIRLAVGSAAAAESACPLPRSPTVSWFEANPGALDCVLRECEDDPGQFSKERACINAQIAAFARLRDLYAGQSQARRSRPISPTAPLRPISPRTRSYRL